LGFLPVEFRGKAHAVVSDGELYWLAVAPIQLDQDLPYTFVRKCVFEGIGQKLVQDQAARDGLVEPE
jgi:hypothetical protein